MRSRKSVHKAGFIMENAAGLNRSSVQRRNDSSEIRQAYLRPSHFFSRPSKKPSDFFSAIQLFRNVTHTKSPCCTG